MSTEALIAENAYLRAALATATTAIVNALKCGNPTAGMSHIAKVADEIPSWVNPGAALTTSDANA